VNNTSVPESVAGQEIADERYHKCETCHTTIDIPLDLYLRLDSGVFQNGKEVKQVDLNEDFYVGVYWCLLGGLAKSICVDWCLSVKFESMGPGEEFSLPYVLETDRCRWCWRYRFSGQQIKEKVVVTAEECADVYRIIVVVTARDKCDKEPVGITGFCDLGVVQFYTGKTAT
jgi:hypothetical protein